MVPEPPADRPRISVVNDNAEFLELMSAVLEEDAGYDVTLHHGDAMSMDELRAARPDVVIIDLILGTSSGWDIVTLARADPELATRPVVICSADVVQLRSRAPELQEIGNIHVLEKPFEIDELTRLVERLIDGDRRPAASGAATG